MEQVLEQTPRGKPLVESAEMLKFSLNLTGVKLPRSIGDALESRLGGSDLTAALQPVEIYSVRG